MPHATRIRPRSPRAPRAVLGAVLLVSLVVLFSPGSTVPSAPSHTDKLVHLLLFAALALTARRAGAGPLPVLVALTAYAVTSELVQGLLPINRGASAADALTDVVGAVLGVLLLEGCRRAVRSRARC